VIGHSREMLSFPYRLLKHFFCPFLRAVVLVGAPVVLCSCMSTTQPGVVGVERQQLLLVSSDEVDKLSAISYDEQNTTAKSKGQLVTSGPELERLKKITDNLIRQTPTFRKDSLGWNWNVVLIDEPIVNATCAAGGKITVYSGLINQLKPTDDEIAAVLAHEIAHALREHSREKYSQLVVQNTISNVALLATKNREDEVKLANQVATLLVSLPYSREMESEADVIGLELMARAGYNPEAALSMQRKLGAASSGQSPPELLSTHPATATRIKDLSTLIPKVMPLYEQAAKRP